MRRFFISLLAAAVLSGFAAARELTVNGYRAEMEQLHSELVSGDLPAAQRTAARLIGVRVAVRGGAFSSDESILRPIRKAASLADAHPQTARIRTLIDALKSAEPPHVPPATDSGLLEKLRRDEEVLLPPKDGEIEDAGIAESGIFNTIFHYLAEGIHWLLQRANDFLKWLESLFPDSRAAGGDGLGPFVKYAVIVFACVAAAVMARIYLKNRTVKRVAAAFEPSSGNAAAKDADPLSRDTSQWEDYALRLNAAGRHREAVRAWYHAVLAMLFRGGFLNYRKGRTNWEYYFSFPQDFALRRDFQALTGSFEQEWYGKSASEPDDAGRYGESAKQFLARARAGRLG